MEKRSEARTWKKEGIKEKREGGDTKRSFLKKKMGREGKLEIFFLPFKLILPNQKNNIVERASLVLAIALAFSINFGSPCHLLSQQLISSFQRK